MYNLHLFDDGRLSTFSRTCSVSVNAQLQSRLDIPSSKILHSLRNLLESSSSFASIMRLLFFISSSSPSWELWQAPIVCQACVLALTGRMCIWDPLARGMSRPLAANQRQKPLLGLQALRLQRTKSRQ